MAAQERGATVYADLNRSATLVGRLYAIQSGGRERAAFRYDQSWLTHPERFALEPALRLDVSPYYPPAERLLFGAFGDSAPDRWGRMLIARAERRRAVQAGLRPRTLHELDYLLGVHDETRQGALRFTALDDDKPTPESFLATGGPAVPPLVNLPRLLAASDRLEADTDTDEDLALLLAPGSSLGGARPKASVRDLDGALALAKFPKASDDYPVVRWEMVAIELARRAGLRVPDARLEEVAGRQVLVVSRFDRMGATRIPFLSAMTLLGAADGDQRSYLEIADALQQYGARAASDLAELWRRMVFTVLISNTDDHLRNHGMLYVGSDGWTLSPAYDLNPTPTDISPRVLRTSIDLDGDATASLDAAMDVHEYFDLDLPTAERIASEVGEAVAAWRAVADQYGLRKSDCDRMATAFDHADLARARSLSV